MINRQLKGKLIYLFTKFPILTIVGPRQSGKTTLAKEAFPHLPYVNMEDLSTLSHAQEDPKGFLANYPEGLIIDEAQKCPDLFSYIQVYSDQKDRPGLYVLTGSQQFLMNEKISQSLAGRVVITTLLPLSYAEIKKPGDNLVEVMYNGFYPRVHRYEITANDFYPSYIQTYIERDVRQIINIPDLALFQKFVKLCAGRIGQLLNVSSLATDCGINTGTANRWLSLLEMSFIIFILKPHHNNYSKRLVKAPKLYFHDTGVACSLLGITSQSQIDSHYAKGGLFENFVIGELLKQTYNQAQQPHFYFWRDKMGHEVDLLIEDGERIVPFEIKSGQTLNSDYFTTINYWKTLSNQDGGYLIYGGSETVQRSGVNVLPWYSLNIGKLKAPPSITQQ